MNRKNLWIIGAVVLLAAVLWAVSFRGNSLFRKASPDSSMLTLYTFDGETGFRRGTADVKIEKKILAALHAVKAQRVTEWTPGYPLYGMEIGTSDGDGLKMLWTNGYLITRTGEVYAFDYDFGAALRELESVGTSWRKIESVAGMPNSYYLALRDGQWNSDYLTPVGDLQAPDGVYLILKEVKDRRVTVVMKNNTGEAWTYGEDFSLRVKLDGQWYAVPTTPNRNWAFVLIGHGLEPGESVEASYVFGSEDGMYGCLPAGTYQLVKEISSGTMPENTFVQKYLTVEFEIG